MAFNRNGSIETGQEQKVENCFLKKRIKTKKAIPMLISCYQDKWGRETMYLFFLALTLHGGVLSASRSYRFSPILVRQEAEWAPELI